MVGLMALRLNFLLPGPFAQMKHFTEAHHRIHDLTFGFIFLPTIAGMLPQLRRPSDNFAGQLMAVIPSAGLIVTLILTLFFRNNSNVLQLPWVLVGGGALVATLLHPASHTIFRTFKIARINRVMLTLVILSVGPMLVLATTNIGLQGTVFDDHARMGHYGFMAAFDFTVIGIGLLASFRPAGWRLTAWITGLLPTLLGLTSMIYPNAASSLERAWAVASIVWGILFVGAAEFIGRRDQSHSEAVSGIGGGLPDLGLTRGASRWVYVVGIIVAALVLLFVLMHLTGGGPGFHTPLTPSEVGVGRARP